MDLKKIWLQTVQRHGMCSVFYCTVHYKEHLTLFDNSIMQVSVCRDIAMIVQKAT